MNDIKTDPAQVQGEAAVIRATPAIFTATVQITRANTGKVEEYQVIGTPIEQPKEPE